MYGRCRSSKQPSASMRARSARRARRAFMSVAAAAVAAAIWAWSKYMPIRAAARVTVLRGLPSSREIFDADQSLPCMTRIFMSSVSESAGPLPIVRLRVCVGAGPIGCLLFDSGETLFEVGDTLFEVGVVLQRHDHVQWTDAQRRGDGDHVVEHHAAGTALQARDRRGVQIHARCLGYLLLRPALSAPYLTQPGPENLAWRWQGRVVVAVVPVCGSHWCVQWFSRCGGWPPARPPRAAP